MLFSVIDDSMDSNALLKVIEDNNKKASEIRNKIKNLQAKSEIADSFDDDIASESDNFIEANDNLYVQEDESDNFEDEVAFYLEDYRQLDIGFSVDDLIDTLPFPNNYNYRKLLMRLSLESLKEIKEMTEILIDEEDEKQRKMIRSYIENERRKMRLISDILNQKSNNNIVSKEVHNNIVLAPTPTGNIRVLDCLEDITAEYYPSFKELVLSICNGTFKGIKRFNHNNVLSGICEVRGFQTRILFQRINKNTYALIDAFIKKGGMVRGYQDYIKLRVTDYKSISGKFKSMLDDPLFVAQNSENIERMNKILGIDSSEKAPTYKKEVQ